MKFVLSSALVLATATALPPQPTQTLCSTLNQTMTVNGEITALQYQGLCMNYDTVSWRQSALYSGDGITYFVLYAEDGETVQECQYAMGESTVDEMPFVMVNVDSVAKDNGEIVVDGVKAQDYLHHRASTSHGGFTMPEEFMHWYLTVPDSALLRSDCVQYYDTSPGDGGNSTEQHGMRDFSTDYDEDRAQDATVFQLPEGFDKDSCVQAQEGQFGLFWEQKGF